MKCLGFSASVIRVSEWRRELKTALIWVAKKKIIFPQACHVSQFKWWRHYKKLWPFQNLESINKLFTVLGFGKFHFCSEQITYQTCPKSHILNTSYMAENGRTMMPSIKSAQAKETMKRLVAPLSLEVILTAVMTMILPKMTMRQTRPKGNSEPITRASWKLTLSKGLLQFLIQKTSCCFDSKLLVASWCDSVELKLVLIADSSWETRPQLKIVHHKDQFSIDL